MLKKIVAVLALMGSAPLSTGQVTDFIGANGSYTILKDSQGRTILGFGVRPTANQNLGITTGMPFYDGPSQAWYWYNGNGWTSTFSAGAVFEGSTDDDFETSIAVADPTADNTVTLANASGTVMLSSLATNAPDIANSVWGVSGRLDFEGATANDFETEIAVVDPTADRVFTLPNTSGVAIVSTLATNSPEIAQAVWGSANGISFEGGVENDFETTLNPANPTADRVVLLPDAAGTIVVSTLATNAQDVVNSIWAESNALAFEGATANDFETTLTPVDATADNVITLPNATATVMVSTFATNAPDAADSVWGVQGALYFEGTAANDFETVINTTNPTADRAINLPNASGTVGLISEFTYAIPDSGGVGAAAYTLDPSAGVTVVTLDCLDADGCSVTMGETLALVGQRLTIIQTAATGGLVTLVHSAGVANLDGAANQVYTGAGDSVTLIYVDSVWFQTAPLYDAS